MGVCAQPSQRPWGPGLWPALLALVVGAMLLAPGAALALETQRWTLQDQAARPWLQLRDGLGGVWELENRSAELVPAGQTALPDGSAQFDLPQLEPQLRGELPLVVIVPLASGDAAQLMASPAAVASLHAATTP